MISFDFLYHFLYENQENKISISLLHFGWHIVSNLVSGVQYTVTNTVCCKISLLHNTLVWKIIDVPKAFVSWMWECVTKKKAMAKKLEVAKLNKTKFGLVKFRYSYKRLVVNKPLLKNYVQNRQNRKSSSWFLLHKFQKSYFISSLSRYTGSKSCIDSVIQKNH